MNYIHTSELICPIIERFISIMLYLLHAMAHKQADGEESVETGSAPNKSTYSDSKGRLNRRNFVKGGAAVTATLLGTGTSLTTASSSDAGTTFMTDFSEYAL
ncbi:twin-arginine translocation signal domain-containing protein [Halorubrum sp. Eb13]|uniref:twin-arginine translocation signal domain-containing protein n=1 Tax=Halorubrum sp. Eb13 TaxID=1383843 RepID=UPI0031B58840